MNLHHWEINVLRIIPEIVMEGLKSIQYCSETTIQLVSKVLEVNGLKIYFSVM